MSKPQKLSEEDSGRLIHELEVHQIELEMQNEELRSSHEALEESRSRYADLYDFAPVGYLTQDNKGLILEINLTAAKQLGMTRASLLKKPITIFITKDSQDIYYSHIKEAFRKKTLVDCEIRIRRKDKSEFYARMTSMAQAGPDGAFNQMRTSISDISVHKELEVLLIESEKRYRTLFDGAADSMYVIEPETQRIIYCNPKSAETSGYTLQQLRGKKVVEMFPQIEQAVVLSILKKVRKAGSLPGISGIHQWTRNRKRVPVEINATVIELGGKRCILCTFRDVTARRTVENALRESEERYQRLSEASFEGIIIHEKGKILDVNRAFTKLFKYSNSDIIGMNWAKLFDPKSRKNALKQMADKYEETYDAVGIRKDGTSFQMEIRSRPILYKEKKANVALVRDISDRMQAEKALRESEIKYRNLVDNSLVGIFKSNVKGNILYVNEASARIFDYDSPEELKSLSALLYYKKPEDRALFIRKLKKKRKISNYVLDVLTKSGGKKHILFNATLEGDIISGMVMDITDRKELEEKLHAAAITDELTGAFNRRGFSTVAEQQCRLADRMNKKLSLIYMDVDNLKKINDGMGHEAGDRALIDTAGILKKCFRKSDVIGRIGGDEFAVLLTESSGPDSNNVVTKHVEHQLSEHNRKSRRKYTISLSMGIAVYNPEDPCPVTKLISRADALMYENKRGKAVKKKMSPRSGGKQERRRNERFHTAGQCRAEIGGIAAELTIEDMSIGGMRLVAPEEMALNDVHDIRIVSFDKKVFSAWGKVVWSHPAGSEKGSGKKSVHFVTGIKFSGWTGNAKKLLRDIISDISC